MKRTWSDSGISQYRNISDFWNGRVDERQGGECVAQEDGVRASNVRRTERA